jgi:ribosomal peptide maturation radical SAM protein 1
MSSPTWLRFVVTPFLPAHQPALGVSSLAAVVQRSGRRSDVCYLNVSGLHGRLSPSLRVFIAKFSQLSLLGEVLFAPALWGEAARPWAAYLDALHQELGRAASAVAASGDWRRVLSLLDQHAAELEAFAASTPALCDAWAARVLDGAPDVVGFSTTFQQNVATLAVARRVKALAPGVPILLGGANCEAEMGEALAASFPFVDHVVQGEAERVILSLLASLEAGSPPARVVRGLPVEQMDTLPIPYFDDYFEEVRRDPSAEVPNLVAETSRGCWWGASSHCTFCGLNGTTMAYRSKSPARALEELTTLAARHGHRRFLMADNILDTRYFRDVIPSLPGRGLELFYEVKSNLRREQVAALAAAGVRWIQPGIESLDAAVLRRIDKGCSPLQNIQLLRWCRAYDLAVFWSILYGFPGDEDASYLGMAERIPALTHLPPPMQAAPFQLQRFSPYFFDAARHGIERVRPQWPYAWAYPGLDDAARAKLAYAFEFDCATPPPSQAAISALIEAVGRWRAEHEAGARLVLITLAGEPAVLDTRGGQRVTWPLSPVERAVLDGLDSARSPGRLAAALGLDPGAVEDAIEALRARRLVVEDGGQMLSLVVCHRGGS